MIREQIINVTASLDGSDDPGSDPDDPSGTVVTSGLYTYYKFDGDFTDSYNGVNGYGNNSPQFVEGVDGTGQAVKFSRTDNSSFMVNSPIIDSEEMTISFWAKGLDDGHIFHLMSQSINAPMFVLYMENGHLKFCESVARDHNYFDDTEPFNHTTVNDGKWHHIVILSDWGKTITGNQFNATLYVDGMSMDSHSYYHVYGHGQYGTGSRFTIGGSLTSHDETINGTNMVIDNFRVYDTRLLSAQEIKQIYEAKQ